MTHWRGRYILLIFDCMMVIGIYFATDMPSALQINIVNQQTTNCSNEVEAGLLPSNTSCCDDCLGLGPNHYNQLYTVSAWTSALMILPVGFLIDKLGNRISALAFTGLATTGTFLIAIASLPGIRGSTYMFPLMLCGRLLLGAGTGSSRIVRDRVLARWFPDKLSLVFGIAVSTMGLGSVLTFLLTSNMAQWLGLSVTLFVGAGVCGTCLLSAVVVASLDWYGSRIETLRSSRTTSKLTSFRDFPLSFWIICLMITTYYSFQLPFTANGGKFIHEKYGYTSTTSPIINGILYDVSVVFSPIVGLVLQKIGHRGWFATLGALLTLPVGPVLLYTNVIPIVGTVWLGLAFTIAVVSLWSSLPYVVPINAVGTANGIASCLMDITVGSTNLAVGEILSAGQTPDAHEQNKNWKYVFLLLFGHAAICTVAGLLLNLVATKKGEKLNASFKRQSSIGPVHCPQWVSEEKDQEKVVYEMPRDTVNMDVSDGHAKNGRAKFPNHRVTYPTPSTQSETGGNPDKRGLGKTKSLPISEKEEPVAVNINDTVMAAKILEAISVDTLHLSEKTERHADYSREG